MQPGALLHELAVQVEVLGSLAYGDVAGWVQAQRLLEARLTRKHRTHCCIDPALYLHCQMQRRCTGGRHARQMQGLL